MRRRAIKYLLLTMGVLVLTTGMGNNMNSSETPVDPSDGIDKRESVGIARAYVLEEKYDARCVLSRPKVQDSDLVENAWDVRFPIKWAIRFRTGLLWTHVHVDKHSGEIKAEGDSPS